MVKKKPLEPNSPHIPYAIVRKMVANLDHTGAERQDTITRLAWRPAWAIRSRRGTLRVLRDMFRTRKPTTHSQLNIENDN